MRTRDGFTLLEVLIALMIFGIIAGVVAPSISRSLAHARLKGAASVIAADMQLAGSLAARQRRPVRISIDTANKVFRVRDGVTPSTIYSERRFGPESDVPVQFMAASDTSVLVYPNGLASKSLTLRIRAAGDRRVVSMSRAGQIRIKGQ